ncbi:MAG: sulfite exporter TauE/SafE family protein [Chromatiales bacterium]|jgi:uncharacterized protein|nr:sulfite exporter TauE/SafE family protein [Chromatiales bacterium]
MQDLTLSLDDPRALAIVAITAFVAGAVRGFSGFGGPAILMLVLTQFYSPATVIAKVLVMDMVACVKLQREALKQVHWRPTIALSIATLAGFPLGLAALYDVEPDMARRGVAALVALSTVAMFSGWRFKRDPPLVIWIAFGALAGAIIGLTGVAMLGMVFLFSMPEKAIISRANALTWLFIVTPPILVAHAIGGTLDWDALWRSVVMSVFYVGGAVIGVRAFRAANEALFRRIVAGLLFVLAVVGFVT